MPVTSVSSRTPAPLARAFSTRAKAHSGGCTMPWAAECTAKVKSRVRCGSRRSASSRPMTRKPVSPFFRAHSRRVRTWAACPSSKAMLISSASR